VGARGRRRARRGAVKGARPRRARTASRSAGREPVRRLGRSQDGARQAAAGAGRPGGSGGSGLGARACGRMSGRRAGRAGRGEPERRQVGEQQAGWRWPKAGALAALGRLRPRRRRARANGVQRGRLAGVRRQGGRRRGGWRAGALRVAQVELWSAWRPSSRQRWLGWRAERGAPKRRQALTADTGAKLSSDGDGFGRAKHRGWAGGSVRTGGEAPIQA
jgi:hypothetical protein